MVSPQELQAFAEHVDKSSTRRRGGQIFYMETQAEARSRRRPAVRTAAVSSLTPRLDARRNRSLIYAWMLEREGRNL